LSNQKKERVPLVIVPQGSQNQSESGSGSEHGHSDFLKSLTHTKKRGENRH